MAAVSEKWQTYSFLLDFKDSGDLGSLFIHCGDSDKATGGNDKKLVVIQTEKLALTVIGGENVSGKSTAIYSAHLTDVYLGPGASGAFRWTDKRTLQGNVRVAETVHPWAGKESYVELTPFLKRGPSAYRQLRKAGEFSFCCKVCSQNLTVSGYKFSSIVNLPRDDWEETSADWFCHSTPEEYAKLESLRKMAPLPEELFVNDSFLVLNTKSIVNVDMKDPGETLHCNRCSGEVGCRMYKRRKPTGAHKFYWCCVDVVHAAEEPDVGLVSFSTVRNRFTSNLRYYSWVLLNQREEHATMKVLLKTLTGEPRVLIWMLDGFFYMVRGILQPEDQPRTKVASRPAPVLKLLYKLFDKDNADDPRVRGEDSSIVDLEMPLSVCTEITELLLRSTQTLPPHLRSIGEGRFYVGFLDMDK